MAVCNLFKELTKDTGNFLMFSQYTDDLTKYLVRHNDFKAIPSRFIALNIDYSSFDNDTLPTLLQNKYENACAFFKWYESDESNASSFVYTPDVSSNIFWNTLYDAGLITVSQWSTQATEIVEGSDAEHNISADLKYIPQIVYRGEINLQSYVEEDNIGYNEIYCYIPNDAHKTIYEVKENEPGESYDYNTLVPASQKNFIMGYGAGDSGFVGLLDINIPNGTSYSPDPLISFWDDVNNQYLESYPVDDRSFKFNTIVVLYDIYSKSGDQDTVIYRDVPMGMYVTGTIDEGVMTNEITKFVANNDIYGAGTSYGLRIATRFASTPNATVIKEITVDGGVDYDAIAKVMTAFAQTQDKMTDVLASVESNDLHVKSQLSSFKNYRTNIPYIVEVNGTKYWFVNGKNTNSTVMGEPGIQGATGAPGPRGEQGIGPAGATGPRGEQGIQGQTGVKGADGEQGVTGVQGVTGERGPRGYQGVTGPMGPTGAGDTVTVSNTMSEGTRVATVNVTHGDTTTSYNINVPDSSEGHIYDAEKDSLAEGVNENMGNLNVASGIRSHAEGRGSQALGDFSHAEGGGDLNYTYTDDEEQEITETYNCNGSIALGPDSHAEGLSTDPIELPLEYDPNTELYSCKLNEDDLPAGWNRMILEIMGLYMGIGVAYVGIGEHTSKVFPIWDLNSVDGDITSAQKYYCEFEKMEQPDPEQKVYILYFAISEGPGADFKGSIIMGLAGAKGDHVEGVFNTSCDISEESIGNDCNGSHVEGGYNVSIGPCNHVEGVGNKTLGYSDHVEGSYNLSQGYCSHAEGTLTEANGQASHAEGYSTTASGEGSHAEGRGSIEPLNTLMNVEHINVKGNTITGFDDMDVEEFKEHAELLLNVPVSYKDNLTTITRYSYVGDGDENINALYAGVYLSDELEEDVTILCRFGVASGDGAHAEGYYTIAGGSGAHAEGAATYASNSAHAEGWNTRALGYASHTEGGFTKATGGGAHAEGAETIASGEVSHAGGYHTIADRDFMTSIGMYNQAGITGALFALGNGEDDNHRSNAVQIQNSANVYIKGIGNYDGTNYGGTGVQSVQEVISGMQTTINQLVTTMTDLGYLSNAQVTDIFNQYQ